MLVHPHQITTFFLADDFAHFSGFQGEGDRRQILAQDRFFDPSPISSFSLARAAVVNRGHFGKRSAGEDFFPDFPQQLARGLIVFRSVLNENHPKPNPSGPLILLDVFGVIAFDFERRNQNDRIDLAGHQGVDDHFFPNPFAEGFVSQSLGLQGFGQSKAVAVFPADSFLD